MRKQELARRTRAARLDPSVSALLDDAFERLDLLDPERHVRDAIACYPRDAIVDAIAIFTGKREKGTLPDDVDARYLLGIVRNLAHVHEADAITSALLRERLAARDRFLEPLGRAGEETLALTPRAALDAMIDILVRADREVDRHFWLDASRLTSRRGERPSVARACVALRAASTRHSLSPRASATDSSACSCGGSGPSVALGAAARIAHHAAMLLTSRARDARRPAEPSAARDSACHRDDHAALSRTDSACLPSAPDRRPVSSTGTCLTSAATTESAAARGCDGRTLLGVFALLLLPLRRRGR